MLSLAVLALGLAGSAAVTQPTVASAGTWFKATQCPYGYELNPQNTQQCVPQNNPFGAQPGSR